jgi:hypothetical protein
MLWNLAGVASMASFYWLWRHVGLGLAIVPRRELCLLPTWRSDRRVAKAGSGNRPTSVVMCFPSVSRGDTGVSRVAGPTVLGQVVPVLLWNGEIAVNTGRFEARDGGTFWDSQTPM